MEKSSSVPHKPMATFAPRVRNALVAAAALLTVMALFFLAYDPYRDVGDDLLEGRGNFAQTPFDGNGAQSVPAWRTDGQAIRWEPRGGVEASGAVKLGTDAAHGSRLDFRVKDADRFKFLRLSGRLRTEGIVAGEAPWNTARLLLLFTDRNGRRDTTGHREVCALTGTEPWRHCEYVFAVPDTAVAAHVHVQNLAAAGTLWVDDLRLTPAVRKPTAFLWNVLFAVAWCAVLAYCLWAVRLSGRWFGVPIIAVGLLIVVAATVPQSTIEETVDLGAGAAQELVNDLRDHLDDSGSGQSAHAPASTVRIGPAAIHPAGLSYMTINTVKKIGHFVLFGLLAFLAFLSALQHRGSRRVATLTGVTAALLLFAAGVEVLQFLSTTRGPSLFDWGVDAAGVVLGATIALITHRLARRTVTIGPAA